MQALLVGHSMAGVVVRSFRIVTPFFVMGWLRVDLVGYGRTGYKSAWQFVMFLAKAGRTALWVTGGKAGPIRQ